MRAPHSGQRNSRPCPSSLMTTSVVSHCVPQLWFLQVNTVVLQLDSVARPRCVERRRGCCAGTARAIRADARTRRGRWFDVSSGRMIDQAATEDRAFRNFNGYAEPARRRWRSGGFGAVACGRECGALKQAYKLPQNRFMIDLSPCRRKAWRG
ncbi:protein of unknown function [Burkholderia multivorans]